MRLAFGARQYLLWYLVFLPVSLGSVSVNPFILALYTLRQFSINKLRHFSVTLPLALSSLILAYGIFFISGGNGTIMAGQLFNFLYLTSLILLLGLNLRIDLDKLCLVVVGICTIYSLWVLVALQISGLAITNPNAIKSELRNYVTHWPQRFSTMFGFAIIVCLPRIRRDLRWGLVLLPLLSADFLTFTRSAWLALIIGAIAYYIAAAFHKPSFRLRMQRRNLFFFLLIGMGLIYFVMSKQQLVTLFTDSFLLVWNRLVFALQYGGITEGSDSDRATFWAAALELWKSSPIFGTGFAGIRSFFPDIGSYHSQYMDYLSRTGIVGLAIYAGYWIFALLHYARHAPEVFGGLVSILIFGMFNETTKLSYTGILLFVLINLALADRRRRAAA
jgi:O-antigen ligase